MLIKKKEETYDKIIEMSKNNNYTTRNLLDYEYFSNHYKLIAIDLSKQIELQNLNLKQQINFIGKLERTEEAARVFIIEKLEEVKFKFSQNSVSTIKNGNTGNKNIINLLNDSSNEVSKFAKKMLYDKHSNIKR